MLFRLLIVAAAVYLPYVPRGEALPPLSLLNAEKAEISGALYVNNVHVTVFEVLVLPRLSVTVAVATRDPVEVIAPVVPTTLDVLVYVIDSTFPL